MTLCLALSYGGRGEIVDAARALAQDARKGNLNPEDISEDLFSQYLYTKDMSDPDLLIRTAGELRVSNFLLWQISYTEIYVTDRYWPDFTKEELHKAIASYQQRDRKYGGLKK